MSVSLLEMSLTGGGMILLTFALKGLAHGRLPLRITAFMWAAALARLILPFSIPSPISLLGFIKGTPQTVMVTQWQGTTQASFFTAEYICLMGSVVCALAFLAAILKQKRVLDMALPVQMTPELKSLLAMQKLSRPLGIYTSDRIGTPLVYGILKPRIVLPSGMKISGEDLQYVITHECVHIKRHDALKKLLLMLVICLHWFNPLVWLMAAVIRRELELACDKRVLTLCGDQKRAAYANTLLSLESRKRFGGILLDHFSRSPLEARIRSIMTVKKAALPGSLAAVVVYGLVSMTLIASPQAQDVITVRAMQMPVAGSVSLIRSNQNMIYAWNGDVLTAARPASIAITSAGVSAQSGLFTMASAPIRVISVYGSAPAIPMGEGATYALYNAQASPTTISFSSEIKP